MLMMKEPLVGRLIREENNALFHFGDSFFQRPLGAPCSLRSFLLCRFQFHFRVIDLLLSTKGTRPRIGRKGPLFCRRPSLWSSLLPLLLSPRSGKISYPQVEYRVVGREYAISSRSWYENALAGSKGRVSAAREKDCQYSLHLTP